MTAKLIDGNALSQSILTTLADTVSTLRPKLGRSPALAVILVGDNPASKVYVAAKSKKAKACGMDVYDIFLPKDIGDSELQAKIKEASARPDIDGILLQLPLPKGLDEFAALCCITPELDADGLHPINQGMLLRGEDAPRPCTPLGCMLLIDEANRMLGRPPSLAGLHAVVIGRSILVGKPVAQLLLESNCTVTICHSRTKDLPAECRRADILVLAIGQPKMITGDFVRPGAIVIDVGINRDEQGKLVGDAEFQSVCEVAAAVTPVPKGVGPMTIAMLLSNTVNAAQKKLR